MSRESNARRSASVAAPAGVGIEQGAGRFPWVGMLALAAAAFLAVTSETLPTGLLPELAGGLHVTTPQAGLLVSVYAFTVVIATTPLTALTRRIPRRPLVVAVIIVIGASSLLLAIAPNYGLAVLARVIGGMAHGVFWAVTGAYAGHIVPAHQLARAVAITSGGVSLAFILGAPIATVLGHAFGWRAAFAVVGCLLLLGAVVVGLMLPKLRTSALHGAADLAPATGGMATVTGGVATIILGDQHRPKRRSRAHDASVRPVMLVCVLTVLITLGSFTLNAYIAPFVSDAMGLGEGAVGPMLFVGGAMGAISVLLVGTVLGRRQNAAALTGLLLTTVGVLLLGVFVGVPPLAIVAYVLWTLAFGCLPPLLQTQLLHVSSVRFRETASALYTTAFNVGIGGGAMVGSVIYAVWGILAVPWAAVAILIVAIVMFVLTLRTRAQAARAGGAA